VEQDIAFFYPPSTAFAGFFVAAGEHYRGVWVLMPMADQSRRKDVRISGTKRAQTA